MTRFVHLTDIHLSDPEFDDPQLTSDTASRLERVIGLIAGMTPAPEFVAVSGDLTNRGDRSSYALLARALSGVKVPLVLALGNHDDRVAFRAEFDPGAAAPDAPFFHHVRLGDVHVIALDSLVPGRIGGAIGRAQCDMLAGALAEHADCRKLILCHHPPHSARPGTLAWESLSPENTEELGAVLSGHDVAGLLCGHVHVDRVLHWRGIPVVISTGLHNSISALETHDTVFEDGAGFAICDIFADALDVTFVPVAPEREVLGRIPHETAAAFR